MRLALAFAVVSAAAVALGASVVSAQQNPIEARQALMKDNGKHAKMGAAMAKGEAPFDLAKAKEIFATYETAAQKMPALFPPDSKTGGDTTASPKIWENKLDFDGKFEKFSADAKKASATVTDLATFKTAFSALGKDCGGCHETYRVKKN